MANPDTFYCFGCNRHKPKSLVGEKKAPNRFWCIPCCDAKGERMKEIVKARRNRNHE